VGNGGRGFTQTGQQHVVVEELEKGLRERGKREG